MIKFAQRLHNFHFCDDMCVSYRLGCVFLWTDSSPGLHWDHTEVEMLNMGAVLLLLIGVADGEIFMALLLFWIFMHFMLMIQL